jgi:hypothetical protein
MFVPQSAVLDNPLSPTRFSNFPEVSRFRVLDSVKRFSDGRLKDDSTVVVGAIP